MNLKKMQYTSRSEALECKLVADIKNSYDVFRKICKDMRCGFLTEAEAKNLFVQNLPNDFIKFPPIPDGVITPDDHPGHFPNEVVVGFDIWEGGGDLLSESFKLGDSIILTDHHGLKAQIQITEHLKSDRKSGDHHTFSGLGTIEGYTASNSKKIRISVRNGQLHFLSFIQDNDDHTVFNSFPLWQEALAYRREFSEMREKSISDLMQHFIEEDV